MDFAPTEMELALREPLDRFLSANYDFRARQRELAAGEWRTDIWDAFAAELGVLGAALPEEVGGLGGGAAEAGAILEVLGRHMVLEPFLPTVVLGAAFLRAWESDAAAELLAAVCAGKMTLAVAHAEERGGYDPAAVSTRAVRRGPDFVLNGRKVLVLNAAQARRLIVVARTSGAATDREGVSAFLVDADAEGLTRRDYRMLDGGSASDLLLGNVVVSPAALIGPEGEALPLLERVLDAAAAAVCSEAAGSCRS